MLQSLQNVFDIEDKSLKIISEKGGFRLKDTAVALGKFDGIHRGHKLLIDEILSHTGEGVSSVVFTFDMRENKIFDISSLRNIYTKEEKREVLNSMGVDYLIEYPFDDEFADMEPEDFVKDILVDRLAPRYLVVGEDFHFGRNRLGDVDMLNAMGSEYGFKVISISKAADHGDVISATRIREEIKLGNVDTATDYLGHPYFIRGEVVHGRELGRTIGIPTANLLPEAGKLYPETGVYAVKVELQDHSSYTGITNIGSNPTVNSGGNVTIETNIFEFDRMIYGEEIHVYFLERVRGEVKFSSLEALREQMDKDIQYVKEKYLTDME